MRVLLLADMKWGKPRGLVIVPRKIAKGLTRNGHDVIPFSYRDVMRHFRWRAKAHTDAALARIARAVEPDLILIMTYKDFDAQSLAPLREALPHAVTCFWWEDMRPDVDPAIARLIPYLDWFCSTGGGEVLRRHHQAGVPHCAFLPNPADADVERPYSVDETWRCDLVFTGTLEHEQPGFDPQRPRALERLVRERGMRVYHASVGRHVDGLDYLRAISGAKIAVSYNGWAGVRLYHSDRLINSLGCGSFVLASYSPDSELLFEDGVHLRYFRTEEECLALVDYYLSHEEERRRIAQAGFARAHEAFACEKIAGYLTDLITRGAYDAPFADVFPPPSARCRP